MPAQSMFVLKNARKGHQYILNNSFGCFSHSSASQLYTHASWHSACARLIPAWGASPSSGEPSSWASSTWCVRPPLLAPPLATHLAASPGLLLILCPYLFLCGDFKLLHVLNTIHIFLTVHFLYLVFFIVALFNFLSYYISLSVVLSGNFCIHM